MGCSSSTQAPLEDLVLTDKFKGDTFSEKLVTFTNGSTRNIATWIPVDEPPKAIVLISHGLHEHALRYYGVAHALTARGYAVFGIDHASHGKSEGTRGLIEDFAKLPEDFVAFSKYVREDEVFKSMKIYLLAHSMGTLVALLSINQITDMDAVVFSGAALFAGPAAASPFGLKALYPITQTESAVRLTRAMASMNPTGPACPILLEGITSDPEEQAILLKDPRRYAGDVMNKTAYEVLKMINAAKAEVPNIRVPFLCLHGGLDPIALPKGSQFIFDNAATPVQNKQCDILPGLVHEIFHERQPYGPDSIARVVDFFEVYFKFGDTLNLYGTTGDVTLDEEDLRIATAN